MCSNVFARDGRSTHIHKTPIGTNEINQALIARAQGRPTRERSLVQVELMHQDFRYIESEPQE